MKIYNLVTAHYPEGVRVRVFFDADAAIEAGSTISPDTDGSIVPNPPEHVWKPFGGLESANYIRGIFWLRNRVAGVFAEDVHPCGCRALVVTSALGNMAEQCSSCGSTWDADDKLTAFRVGVLNEEFAQARTVAEEPTAELESKPFPYKTGNMYAADAYQAYHLGDNPAAALEAIRNAFRVEPGQADRWRKLTRTYRGLPVVPSGTPLDDQGEVIVPAKKLGDMTPAERAVAVKNASNRMQAELDANAPAITEILEGDADEALRSLPIPPGPWDQDADLTSQKLNIDPSDLAEVLAALDLERARMSYQEQAHFVLDWLYKLDPSYSIQRHVDGQLYWLTEQEHADGFTPGPERRVL